MRKKNAYDKMRTYPLEIQSLVRWRLLHYLDREGVSRFEFAYELSMWPKLELWIANSAEWQRQNNAAADGAEGFMTDAVQKGRTDKGWPITGRILDRWLYGEPDRSQNGQWIYPAPSKAKLNAVIDYLIERGVLDAFELKPDDRGFGLAMALQGQLGLDDQVPSIEEWQGTFEAVQHHRNQQIHHKLRVQSLSDDGPLFVVLGQTYGVHARAPIPQYVSSRLSAAGVTLESKCSGWAIRLANQSILAALKPLQGLHRPAIWIFHLTVSSNEPKYVLEWCGDEKFKGSYNAQSSNNYLHFVKKLQINTEIDYILKRSGENDINIIRRILGMKDFTEASKGGELSDLDREFLKAIYCLDCEKILETVDAGANINAVNPQLRETALLTMARLGGDPIVEFLLEQPGIDPLIKDGHHGYLPSQCAMYFLGNSRLAAKLVEAEGNEMRRRGLLPERSPKLG